MPYISNSFGTFYSLNKVNKDYPIIFVHGVGLNNEIWKPQINFFKEYSTLAYDLLGHGKTPLKKSEVTFNDFSRQLLNLINELKFNKPIYFIIALICVFATFKYHLRYNDNRKFHELKNVNFELAVDAKKIHKKLSGLNWITPQFKKNPIEEINVINQIQSLLRKDSRNKMVITNYPFFSIILDQKLYSPSRVYTGDGTTHPLRGSEYAAKYKELMDNIILKNNISVIYVINTVNKNTNFHYINLYQHCFEEISLLSQLKSYELKNCN